MLGLNDCRIFISLYVDIECCIAAAGFDIVPGN